MFRRRYASHGERGAGNEQLQGLGFIKDNYLVCTSAGLQNPPFFLGKPDIRTRPGNYLWAGIKLPFARTARLLVAAAPSGYSVFIHPRLMLDMPLNSAREGIGLVSISRPRLLNQRGAVDGKALMPFFQSGRTTFVVHDRVVVVVPSKAGDYAGFAALPVDDGMQRYLLFLLPIGLMCGIVLVFLLRMLVRFEKSFETIAKRAFRSDEFYLDYQPLVELSTGRWVGAEALVRWRRANGEELRPDIFIPYLEEAGVIPLLTDKVFQLLAVDLKGDLSKRADFYVAINLASVDLRRNRLAGLIDGLLAGTGCGGEHFVIEATERGIIDAEDGNHALRAVRDRGVRVALDDYGTGYSSLAYLQQFPLDYIKIDKSFVDSIATQAATSSVVVHIISMAQDLKLGLIAEGVETEEQARFLVERGVTIGQGWLFARPMPWRQLMDGLDVATR